MAALLYAALDAVQRVHETGTARLPRLVVGHLKTLARQLVAEVAQPVAREHRETLAEVVCREPLLFVGLHALGETPLDGGGNGISCLFVESHEKHFVIGGK